MELMAVAVPFFVSQKPQYQYNDNNGIIHRASESNISQHSRIWTDEEIDIFTKKFIQYPKQFDVIASYLKYKSTCDCVQYYYLTKKKVNYKLLLRKLTFYK